MLLVSEEAGVVTLTLNRAAVRNAVDGALMTALSEAIDGLAPRDDLVAVILTGAGSESFCAGGDLKWLRTFATPARGSEMSRRMQDILQRLSELPAPVIGVLNGYALGGGTEVALACDLRVMEEHSRLAFKQARVGVMSGWGGGPRLLRLVGYARALELFATCRTVTPDEALALGLANRVAPSGRGLGVARELADSFRPASGRSIRTIKKLLQGAASLDQQAAAELEATLFADVWCSPEHDAAVAAFLEKRRPDFGR